MQKKRIWNEHSTDSQNRMMYNHDLTYNTDFEEIENPILTTREATSRKTVTEFVFAGMGDVENLQNQVDVIDTRLDTAEVRLDNVENRVTDTETRLDDIDTKLDSVENRLDIIEDDISNLQTDVSELETRVDTGTNLLQYSNITTSTQSTNFLYNTKIVENTSITSSNFSNVDIQMSPNFYNNQIVNFFGAIPSSNDEFDEIIINWTTPWGVNQGFGDQFQVSGIGFNPITTVDGFSTEMLEMTIINPSTSTPAGNIRIVVGAARDTANPSIFYRLIADDYNAVPCQVFVQIFESTVLTNVNPNIMSFQLQPIIFTNVSSSTTYTIGIEHNIHLPIDVEYDYLNLDLNLSFEMQANEENILVDFRIKDEFLQNSNEYRLKSSTLVDNITQNIKIVIDLFADIIINDNVITIMLTDFKTYYEWQHNIILIDNTVDININNVATIVVINL